jgi:hypothetical protein
MAPIYEQISALAYGFWKERGCPEGDPKTDWFKAERVLWEDVIQPEGDDAEVAEAENPVKKGSKKYIEDVEESLEAELMPRKPTASEIAARKIERLRWALGGTVVGKFLFGTPAEQEAVVQSITRKASWLRNLK